MVTTQKRWICYLAWLWWFFYGVYIYPGIKLYTLNTYNFCMSKIRQWSCFLKSMWCVFCRQIGCDDDIFWNLHPVALRPWWSGFCLSFQSCVALSPLLCSSHVGLLSVFHTRQALSYLVSLRTSFISAWNTPALKWMAHSLLQTLLQTVPQRAFPGPFPQWLFHIIS